MNRRLKTVLFILLLIAYISPAAAQERNHYATLQEMKGKNNVYELGDGEIGYGVWNKENRLMDITPSFLYFEVIPRIEIENEHLIDSLVIDCFKPYFMKPNAEYSYPYLYFYFFGDEDGRIKEITMRYPKEAGLIPAEVIEKFETSLLNDTRIKLKFDKNYRVFKGSEWVGRAFQYNSDEIKDM